RRLAAATDRCTHLALVAARLALSDADLDLERVDRNRVGIAIGTGIGGAETWHGGAQALAVKGPTRLGPRFIPKAMCNNAAAVLAIDLGVTGPTCTPVLACASGADAIVAAYQMIAAGEVDMVLAGG